MNTVILVQFLNEIVYISYTANTLGESINQTFLSPAKGK